MGGHRALEIDSLSRPAMTSYRLPKVTIGLSLTIFAVIQHVTDGRNILDIFGKVKNFDLLTSGDLIIELICV